MKIKVCDMKPHMLDKLIGEIEYRANREVNADRYQPTTDWNAAGRIIEREKLELMMGDKDTYWISRSKDLTHAFGDTPLMAVMRCYAISVVGEEVDIPDEQL